MYKTYTYGEPRKKLQNYSEVENSEVYNENYEHPIYQDSYTKAKKKREKEKQLEEDAKSLPKYKHKFAISPKIPGIDKAKFISISFSGTIYSEYEIGKPKGSTEKRDDNNNPEHNIVDFEFERDYVKNQIAIAANSKSAKLIDFGSGITLEVGATFFQVNSNGEFSKPMLELQAKGRLTASSEDGPVKQMITQIYGHDLFKKGSIVDIVAKIEIDTTQASKELLEFANKHKRQAKALEEEAKNLKEQANKLKETRKKALDDFVKDEINDYNKRNGKMPSKGKIEKYVEKFYRTETNSKLQKEIKALRKRASDIKDELKQIQKILRKRLRKVTGILDGPIIRGTLSVVGRILAIVGTILDVIGAIIVTWQLANDIMRYGVQFGFNPLAILGLDEKGPEYDNPPIFVKGDGKNVESDEPVHNDPFNFILESGDGEKEGLGNGKGNIESGTDDSPTGTVKNGKSGTNNAEDKAYGNAKKGTGTKTAPGAPAKDVKASEQKDGVKASEIKKLELLYSEEGNTLEGGESKVIQNVRVVEKRNLTNTEGSTVMIEIYFYATAKGEFQLFHFTDVEAIIRLNADEEKVYEIANSRTYKFRGGIKVCLEKEKIFKNEK